LSTWICVLPPCAANRRRSAPVRHRHHYTLEQASAQLPWIGEQLIAMRRAREGLSDADSREALAEASTGNGGGAPGKRVADAYRELQASVTALGARDIVVRDLERGLVDFPAIRDGREVYLCWVEGEPEIGFWHELDAGYAGRQEL
jgi:hypothetical protein